MMTTTNMMKVLMPWLMLARMIMTTRTLMLNLRPGSAD